MENIIDKFDHQHLSIANEKWQIELIYKSKYLLDQEETINNIYPKISLNPDYEYKSAQILINVKARNNDLRSVLITEIDGEMVLEIKNKEREGQSVKLEKDELIISCGSDFISVNLNRLELNWKIKPDIIHLFEFYDFENGYLLRGEVAIYKIDKSGNIEWSFGGKDIWVNIDGEPEVQIFEDYILLTDFNGEKYKINFEGKVLK